MLFGFVVLRGEECSLMTHVFDDFKNKYALVVNLMFPVEVTKYIIEIDIFRNKLKSAIN